MPRLPHVHQKCSLRMPLPGRLRGERGAVTSPCGEGSAGPADPARRAWGTAQCGEGGAPLTNYSHEPVPEGSVVSAPRRRPAGTGAPVSSPVSTRSGLHLHNRWNSPTRLKEGGQRTWSSILKFSARAAGVAQRFSAAFGPGLRRAQEENRLQRVWPRRCPAAGLPVARGRGAAETWGSHRPASQRRNENTAPSRRRTATECLGCGDEAPRTVLLKPQTFALSPARGLQAQDQGVGEAWFPRSPSPWLALGTCLRVLTCSAPGCTSPMCLLCPRRPLVSTPIVVG